MKFTYAAYNLRARFIIHAHFSIDANIIMSCARYHICGATIPRDALSEGRERKERGKKMQEQWMKKKKEEKKKLHTERTGY